MRKLQCVFIFSLAVIANMFSQDKVGDMIALAEVPESIALIAQANSYADAVLSKDYQKVADLTHEDIITMGGGADFLMSDLKAEQSSLEGQGMKFVSAEVGSHPEFLSSDGQLQTIVPVKFHLDYNSKKVESWVKLFAVSSDEGISWTFVNLEKFDETSLRDFVKNVSTELVYPE